MISFVLCNQLPPNMRLRLVYCSHCQDYFYSGRITIDNMQIINGLCLPILINSKKENVYLAISVSCSLSLSLISHPIQRSQL